MRTDYAVEQASCKATRCARPCLHHTIDGTPELLQTAPRVYSNNFVHVFNKFSASTAAVHEVVGAI